MSISADSPSDETLNRGLLALLLRRQYEFPFGINIMQFSIFKFFLSFVLCDSLTLFYAGVWMTSYDLCHIKVEDIKKKKTFLDFNSYAHYNLSSLI